MEAVRSRVGAARHAAGMRRAQRTHAAVAFRSRVGGADVLRASSARPAGRQARGSAVRVAAVFERFTERAIKAVMLAQQEAKLTEQKEVGTVHILLGLVAEAESVASQSEAGFLGTGVKLATARAAAKDYLHGKPVKRTTTEVPFSRGSKRVFENALEESTRMGMSYIAPEHILLALASLDNAGVKHMFTKMEVDAAALKKEATRRLRGELEKEGSTGKLSGVGGGRQEQRQAASKQKEGANALDEFCRDLTAEARAGKTDPVIGRDDEVQRVVQILARRTKNNPILLGEPGVGKTAIAEGVALQIASGLAPDFLAQKRVMSLDVGLLMAGAKERGELESRLTNLMKEAKESGNVILMIDEVHTVVGAGTVGGRGGGGGGGLDISNMLKPALARGELQCIGATTLDEHRKYIEKDAALERRFQPVIVDEPSEDEALEILTGLRPHYETHHKCYYDDEALEACVTLSARYIADRFLPDKAIDLLDEAGSRARIAGYMKSKLPPEEALDASLVSEVSDLWQELKQVVEAKESAVASVLYEEALLLRQRELEVKAMLRERGAIADELAAADGNVIVAVGRAEIETVAASWTRIPVEQLSTDDVERLQNMDKVLGQRVIGQLEAISAISRSMRRARSGLKDPERPIASMLFSGPTGVGKTEITKALADNFFGSEEAMVRLDMSEYMERHTVSKLVGAPPGYVGFGEGGTLTEAVRQRPFCIVLLDEVEKAHPDVFNLLLQVMEDGRLTDSQGRTVSFKNTLIVMTSNVGSQVIAKGGGGLGFEIPDDTEEDGGEYQRVRSLVLEELRSFFKPELLNRLDEVVVFRQLERTEVRQIADIMLEETARRLIENCGAAMQLTERMMAHLLDQGYDKQYGARPMRRAVMSLIDDTLSEHILSESLEEGDIALFDVDEDGQVSVTRCKPGERCESPERADIVFSSASWADGEQ